MTVALATGADGGPRPRSSTPILTDGTRELDRLRLAGLLFVPELRRVYEYERAATRRCTAERRSPAASNRFTALPDDEGGRMPKIDIEAKKTIRRPLAVVSRQFGDMQHHAETGSILTLPSR